MKVIYKFEVTNGGVTLPVGSKIIHAGEQLGRIVIWAIVDKKEPLNEIRMFNIYATGFDPIQDSDEFIGTVKLTSGLVYHIFEEKQGRKNG